MRSFCIPFCAHLLLGWNFLMGNVEASELLMQYLQWELRGLFYWHLKSGNLLSGAGRKKSHKRAVSTLSFDPVRSCDPTLKKQVELATEAWTQAPIFNFPGHLSWDGVGGCFSYCRGWWEIGTAECYLWTPGSVIIDGCVKRGTLKRPFQPEGKPRERGSSACAAISCSAWTVLS